MARFILCLIGTLASVGALAAESSLKIFDGAVYYNLSGKVAIVNGNIHVGDPQSGMVYLCEFYFRYNIETQDMGNEFAKCAAPKIIGSAPTGDGPYEYAGFKTGQSVGWNAHFLVNGKTRKIGMCYWFSHIVNKPVVMCVDTSVP
jgi:hypothetical protein